MWKPLIYLDSSVFTVLHPSNQVKTNSREISLELLSRCKEQKVFKGYASPFLIHELGKQFDDLSFFFDLLETYDITYLTFSQPKDIDNIANGLANKKILSERNTFDYFHLATCAYLAIEYFVTWDRERLNNFDAENKIHRANYVYYYRNNYKIVNPAFLIGKEHTEPLEGLLKQSLLYKKEIGKLFDTIEFGKRSALVQGLVKPYLAEIKKRAISIIDTPTEQMRCRTVHEAPEYEDIPLGFELKNYDEAIELKQFPLLTQNEYLESSCIHNFKLYHYKVTEGVDLLKGMMVKTFRGMPIKSNYLSVETREKEVENYKQNKADFINWLIPQLLSSIDYYGEKKYEEIRKDDFQEFGHSGIDQAIIQLLETNENIRPLKDLILNFVDFLTDGNWKNYRGYTSSFDWHYSMQNTINNTFIMINKEAKDIWLLLVAIDCG